MHSQAPNSIRISTDRLLLTDPVAQAVTWPSLTPSLKTLMGVLQCWLDMDPPEFVTPTALALKGVHFDYIVLDHSGKNLFVLVCSALTARLAGRSLNGRSISEALSARWTSSILDQLQTVRYTQNLVYRITRELVDGHFSNVHHVAIPLSFDGKLIDEYIIASQAVPAQ